MNRTIQTLAIILFSSFATYGQVPGQTDQVILKLKNESYDSGKASYTDKAVGNTKVDNVSRRFNAVGIRELSPGKNSIEHLYILKFPPSTNIQQVIDDLYKTGEVEYAEPDYIGSGGGTKEIAPNDPYYSRQWGLHNDGSFAYSPAKPGADIDMQNAWSTEQGDTGIIVGLIDSGIKFDHPEFAGRIWTNYKEIPNNGIDDDKNTYIDDVRGWDYANQDNNPTDDFGHGTNVSGIIGANGNNTTGYAGVDWNCRLMMLKGLDNNNSGYYSWWSNALYYAVDNGANIINMSLGGINNSTTLQNAVNYAVSKNVAVVACMMNSNAAAPYYPAAFPGVIAVGSTNPDDSRTKPFFWNSTSGSNFGNHISVTAPGNFIFGLDFQSNTYYNYYWGGTSQSTALVTGLASLLLAQNPKLTPPQIKSIIETTAEDLVGNPTEDTPGWDQYYGHGRINAFKALTKFTGVNPPNPQNQSVILYPNPTSGAFTAIVPAGTRELQVFNSMGKSILRKDTEGRLLNTMQLTGNGIYYIQANVDGKVITGKIIVNK